MFGDGTLYKGKNRAYAVWIDQHQRNSKVIKKVVKEFKKLKLNVYNYEFMNKERALIYSKEIYIEILNFKNYGKFQKFIS